MIQETAGVSFTLWTIQLMSVKMTEEVHSHAAVNLRRSCPRHELIIDMTQMKSVRGEMAKRRIGWRQRSIFHLKRKTSCSKIPFRYVQNKHMYTMPSLIVCPDNICTWKAVILKTTILCCNYTPTAKCFGNINSRRKQALPSNMVFSSLSCLF